MCANILPYNNLFIIPSWGDLIGYPTLGKYLSNQEVSRIHSDIVIFFGGSECTIVSDNDKFHLIFGLGYYYTKFELNPGEYVIDHKQLTGLILPDFIVNYMAKSKNLSINAEERNIIFKENIIKVPLNLSNKSETAITFIKGALIRNVFTPNKEIILEMMKHISDPNSYNIEKYGHQILSSHPKYFNKILLSNKMEDYPDKSYFEPTAGIESIVYGYDEFIMHYFSQQDQDLINLNIQLLKQVYSKVEIDPMYLYSVLENSANQLNSLFIQNVLTEQKEIPPLDTIESIFNSADYNFKTDIAWPEEFKRKSKMYYEALIKPPKLKKIKYEAIPQEKIDIPENYGRGPIEDGEKFELDVLKQKEVELKKLPNPPEGNIIEILNYLNSIIKQDYDMISIGKAFDLARDNIRKIILQSDYMWEMSKYANFYQRQKPKLGLNERDRKELLEKIQNWINNIKEEERKKKEEEEIARKIKEETERLERERIEKERLEKERIEKERLERERIEKERLEKERIEKEKIRKDTIKRKKSVFIKPTVELGTFEIEIKKIEDQIDHLLEKKPSDRKERKENKKELRILKKELKKLKKLKKKEEKKKKKEKK